MIPASENQHSCRSNWSQYAWGGRAPRVNLEAGVSVIKGGPSCGHRLRSAKGHHASLNYESLARGGRVDCVGRKRPRKTRIVARRTA